MAGIGLGDPAGVVIDLPRMVGVVRFVTLKPNEFAMFQPGDGM